MKELSQIKFTFDELEDGVEVQQEFNNVSGRYIKIAIQSLMEHVVRNALNLEQDDRIGAKELKLAYQAMAETHIMQKFARVKGEPTKEELIDILDMLKESLQEIN